ncbi:MAG: prepilin-type N-terminal cleavage/methylation domain-containing protein [Clostridia bacterium]
MKKIVNNRNDGITLIALVVTIVILLILARSKH